LGRFVELDRAYRPRRADPQRRFKHLGRHPNPRVSGKPAEILPTQIFREPTNASIMWALQATKQ
ncbi:hypothetical protein, partial [Xanthomonas oryzae]